MSQIAKWCPLCGRREGERLCLRVEGEFICSLCCERLQDERCRGCPYIAGEEVLIPGREVRGVGGGTQPSYISSYLDKHQNVRVAVQELEGKHGHVYDEMAQDEALLNDLAFRLFAQEEFSDLHFDFQTIERCFQDVGYPPTLNLQTKEMALYVRDAVLAAATPELRAHLAINLLQRIPAYVQKREYREAWLMLLSSYLTAGMLDEPNPFLAQMFLGGLVRWLDWKDQQLEEKLRELGLYPEEAPLVFTPEFGEWLAKRMGDTQTWKEVDRLLAEHPEFEFVVKTRTDEMVMESSNLLEREDFQPFFFSPGELIDELEQLVDSLDRMFTMSKERGISDEELWREADSIYMAVAQRGLERIFNQKRKERLISQLSDYIERFKGKETPEALRVVQAAHGALFSLKLYEDDRENPFLVGLMMASLHQGLQQIINRLEQS